MTRVLVTGSTDGIGAEIVRELAAQGHQPVAHARSDPRRKEALAHLPEGTAVVVGDLESLKSTENLARQLAELGGVDVVVHNAGFVSRAEEPRLTDDGIEETLQVNLVAPYVLTALLPTPARIVFVSSDSIVHAHLDLADLQLKGGWTAASAYANSKLAVTTLAFGVARLRPHALVNAVHPGWVRTKLSGQEAPLSVEQGADSPTWLAVSQDPAALVSGALFHERHQVRLNEQAYEVTFQNGVLAACSSMTGLDL